MRLSTIVKDQYASPITKEQQSIPEGCPSSPRALSAM